jgi:nucleoside-diphosphate-sugar epimerase
MNPSSNLNNKKILITGAGGFVGSVLLREIIKKYPNAKIYITLRQSTNTWRIKDLLKKTKVLPVDLTDFKVLKNSLQKIKPEIIFHLASYGAYPKFNSLPLAIKTNIVGLQNLLLALEGINYQTFVNTGTSSEYGFKAHPMKEKDMLEPNSFYASTKASATLIANTYGTLNSKPVLTLRLFSVYGPYEEQERLVPTVILRALKNLPLCVVGDNQKRDFVYIEDVVDAYIKCCSLKKFDQRIFNICSGKQFSIVNVVKMIKKITNSSSKIMIGNYDKRPWDTSYWVGDKTQSSNVLKWKTSNSLEQGLTKSVEWFKNNYHLYPKQL